MNKKILKKFITITSLALAFIFITINSKAEVTDAERGRLQDIEKRIEQHAQNQKPNYQDRNRPYKVLLSKDDTFFVLEIFNREQNGKPILAEFNIPEEGAVCTSDWHGDLPGLIDTSVAARNQGKSYIITGDLVDRGRESVECATYAFIQAIFYPNRFFYLAGDHEFENVNRRYGLYAEIRAKYKAEDADSIFNAFNHSFEYLPLAAIANEKAFFVHGGFGATTSVENLRRLTAPRSSWETREVSLDDEERLNPQQQELFRYLKRSYNFPDSPSGEMGDLGYLRALLTPGKMVLDMTWANFLYEEDDMRYHFPRCTARGFGYYLFYDQAATSFTIGDVGPFFNKNNLKVMFRGHEHSPYKCGGRQVCVGGKHVVTTTSSKNIYLFENNSRSLLLPKGDVIHITEDLGFSFQDTDKYIADSKLEEQRKQGQANCDALLKQMDEFKFQENYESEQILAREQEGLSKYSEALEHQIKAQIAAFQALTFEYTALADKHEFLNTDRSAEFSQKAKKANEYVEIFRNVLESTLQLKEKEKELKSIPRRRFIKGASFKRASVAYEIKQISKKIKAKVNLTKDLVTHENAEQLVREGMKTFGLVESFDDTQRLLEMF
jgi:diadenosine tetraphosphatase ApaH/serine/threonine PP2A family protein phosphatase